MKVKDVVALGTKIDIRMAGQMKKQEEGGERAPVYKSVICDFLSDTELEIAMPTEGGRMVLFHNGGEVHMIFYAKGGMYTTTGVVSNRYRKDGFYMISVKVTGSVVKFQRRDFYRVTYMADVDYRTITRDIAWSSTIEEVEFAIAREADLFSIQTGRLLDVSGGGIRFSSVEPIDPNTFLFMNFKLANSSVDELFSMVGRVISSDKHPKEPDMYINRIEFLFKDLREREKIVRFVFEEERMIRNKGAIC